MLMVLVFYKDKKHGQFKYLHFKSFVFSYNTALKVIEKRFWKASVFSFLAQLKLVNLDICTQSYGLS